MLSCSTAKRKAKVATAGTKLIGLSYEGPQYASGLAQAQCVPGEPIQEGLASGIAQVCLHAEDSGRLGHVELQLALDAADPEP